MVIRIFIMGGTFDKDKKTGTFLAIRA